MKTMKHFLMTLFAVGMVSLVSCGEKDNGENSANGGNGGNNNGGGSERVEIRNGVLPGVFSISETKKVRFSMGNLQFSTDGSHDCADGNSQQGTWRFAARQYDCIGEDNQYISDSYSGYIDLFGWATSGYHDASDNVNLYYMPYSTSVEYDEINNSYGYGPWYLDDSRNNLTGNFKNYDWGVFNAISNGGNAPNKWRTLTQDEWFYLLNRRAPAYSASMDSAMFCMATVCNVKGMIIFPDNYVHPADLSDLFDINQYDGQYYRNEIDSETWNTIEKAGAVFLPAAGMRTMNDLNYTGLAGYYWSTDSYSQHGATALRFYDGYTNTNGYVSNRCVGYSVRLVQDI